MVKIRLRRTGAKKQPNYRVVVTDSRSPRDGKFIETIGHYNPRTEPVTVEIDAERALYWLSVGAQPSPAVSRMLDKMGIMAQVTAVRKGEVPIDEILAQLQAEKAETVVAKSVVAAVVAEAVAQEVEQVAEEAVVEALEADEEIAAEAELEAAEAVEAAIEAEEIAQEAEELAVEAVEEAIEAEEEAIEAEEEAIAEAAEDKDVAED